ncbi:MAG: rhodanese-like domain-containing protein [Lachnospiraceae bacterium]|nr:rhodanese-like domain-containing protein [Lachnospiraceae bacterium]
MKELETIAFRELDKYKNDKSCIIIDLRSKELYQKGHVDGAWNIPYEYLVEEAWNMLPREKLLLLYCERGGAAMMAGRELTEKGFSVKAAVGGFEH